jgi:hypothetical protein
VRKKKKKFYPKFRALQLPAALAGRHRLGPIPYMPLENILISCVPLASNVIHTKNIPICHSVTHRNEYKI